MSRVQLKPHGNFVNEALVACNINLFHIVVAPINRGVLATMLNKLSNYIYPELLLQSTSPVNGKI
jgi:hypothetical protein